LANRILFCANDFVMFEIFEIFWTAKIELRVIILAVLIGSCFWYLQNNKRKQKEKQQERLNQIR
jgi:hypothetical protein